MTDWGLRRDPSTAWVVVNVVGQVAPLSIDEDGNATLRISPSPAYILSKAAYDRLTQDQASIVEDKKLPE